MKRSSKNIDVFFGGGLYRRISPPSVEKILFWRLSLGVAQRSLPSCRCGFKLKTYYSARLKIKIAKETAAPVTRASEPRATAKQGRKSDLPYRRLCFSIWFLNLVSQFGFSFWCRARRGSLVRLLDGPIPRRVLRGRGRGCDRDRL